MRFTKKKTYKVEVRIDEKTNRTLSETWLSCSWLRSDVIEREDGPAMIDYDPETGKVCGMLYYRNGRLDRVGAPASIAIDPASDVVVRETYCLDGKIHRAGGPAVIERDRKTGAVTSERFFRNGQEFFPKTEQNRSSKLEP